MRSLKMEFDTIDLGLIDFNEALRFQKEVFRRIKDNAAASTLIFCRHYPVITLGRNAQRKNILAEANELKNKGIGVYAIERGGDVTYHGPGQITVYPVFNLNHIKKDIHYFLRHLEDTVIGSLEEFGIKGARIERFTGVWVGKEKIASIGITVKNWITMHGLSINIKRGDLDNFKLIKPCGMDIIMTSMETITDKEIEIGAIKEEVIRSFHRVFK